MGNKFSKIGFILAAAGSAVGLGNIWKFPYIVGEYGGGAFVLLYLAAILFIGLSAFIAESFLGKISESNAVTAFEKMTSTRFKESTLGTIEEKSSTASPLWKYAGFMVLSGLVILSFYSVVLGWIINYIFISFSSLSTDVKVAEETFSSLISEDIFKQIFFHTLVALTVVWIVLKGIKDGIEKANLVLMPLLGVILLGLFVYAISLDSFSEAVKFMFVPDWSKIDEHALLAALGQAFFTLSVGVGTILTYSAALPKEANVVKSSILVTIIDTGIAIIAGLTIFAFLFEAGAESSGGPGLVFISLPLIFAKWGIIGQIISISFFVALAFAGITSAVSMIEPILLYFIERLDYSRKKAVLVCGSIFYVGGLIALLSMSKDYGEYLTFFGKNAFDWMDFVTSSITLPLGGILICLFLGFVVDKELIKSHFLKSSTERIFNIWYATIRYVVPTAVSILMLNKLGLF
ncbi:MAG: sodium-dependent transporter [SAR324 cluster bacterium]|uniref:Transporter n=1 Tax=SAR324 cluster bacterium TaxID=2024889 RepID=A0A2A4TB44_9DELT|nr:MAG: sodium-dependent transporter [SAR324 cluster bacterium]